MSFYYFTFTYVYYYCEYTKVNSLTWRDQIMIIFKITQNQIRKLIEDYRKESGDNSFTPPVEFLFDKYAIECHEMAVGGIVQLRVDRKLWKFTAIIKARNEKLIEFTVNNDPYGGGSIVDTVDGLLYEQFLNDELHDPKQRHERMILMQRFIIHLVFEFEFFVMRGLELRKVTEKEYASRVLKQEKENKKKNKTRKPNQQLNTIINMDEIVKYIKPGDFKRIITGTSRTYHCEDWEVRGHWRHYKSGKKVFINSYHKGAKRNEGIEKDKTYTLKMKGDDAT